MDLDNGLTERSISQAFVRCGHLNVLIVENSLRLQFISAEML